MPAFACTAPATPANETIIAHLGAAGQAAIGHLDRDGDLLRLVLTQPDIDALTAAGVPVTVGAPLLTRAERDDVAATTDLTTGFVTGYLDALEVDAQMTALASAHPTWCSVITLPNATSGYDGSHGPAVGPATVRALRITANPAMRNRPGFLLICGTHAREWMNPLIGLEFAQQLLSNIDPTSTEPETIQATRIVTEGDVIIVPVPNPDGLNFSIHDDAGWRKNRRVNAGSPGCPGVDDNRNFSVYFGGPGSSGSPCVDNYRGIHAFSESESANVRWLLEEFPNILIGVDSHSFGNAVFRPQPGGGSFISALPVSAADEAIYAGLETTFTNAVAAVNGTTYSTGTTSNHAGTSDEYMFFAHRVFAFDTECGLSFQPPWSQAAPIIQEVAAGFRALAEATLDLSVTTPTPLAAVQCIDRTGSMVTFGYDTAARNNAKRFIDLMSLGDSAGVVSFADPSADPTATPVANRAQTEFPLTLLDDPGNALTAMAAIDGISFGGWTPIGAGLDRAASLLGGAANPRGILLLSDGFENRDPPLASVLAGWPANLPVYSIALGTSADTTLLSDVATQTGGQFQISPTALDLHLVYNQMRADMSDADTIANEVAMAGRDEEADHGIDVEIGVDMLDLSISSDRAVPGKIELRSPAGRTVSASDFGARITRRQGYVLIRVERPAPGSWSVLIGGVRAPYAIAAFARSPLALRTRLVRAPRGELVVEATARFDKTALAAPKIRVRSQAIRPFEPNRVIDPVRLADPDTPLSVLNRLRPAAISVLRSRGTAAGLASVRQSVAAVSRTLSAPDLSAGLTRARLFAGPWLHWRGDQVMPPAGFSRAYIEVEGALPGGTRFKRVAWKTVYA